MIVQWCIKGMSLPDDKAAKDVIEARQGILCNWWRKEYEIDPADTSRKLTPPNLDMHVNHFTSPGEDGLPFNMGSPFISLSAGTVERDAVARANLVHRARTTALRFGTNFGQRHSAYLYTCWVLLAPRTAVEIAGVAEEIRDLNTFRRYSDYQLEGEVVAKVSVEDNQIERCEKWTLDPSLGLFRRVWTQMNSRFVRPERLTNVRELI